MTYFPIGLLTIVCYVTPMCVMASKGNLFRSIVTTILCLFLVTFLTNFFAPECNINDEDNRCTYQWNGNRWIFWTEPNLYPDRIHP